MQALTPFNVIANWCILIKGLKQQKEKKNKKWYIYKYINILRRMEKKKKSRKYVFVPEKKKNELIRVALP